MRCCPLLSFVIRFCLSHISITSCALLMFSVFLGEPFNFPCAILWKKSKEAPTEFSKIKNGVAWQKRAEAFKGLVHQSLDFSEATFSLQNRHCFGWQHDLWLDPIIYANHHEIFFFPVKDSVKWCYRKIQCISNIACSTMILFCSKRKMIWQKALPPPHGKYIISCLCWNFFFQNVITP